MEESIKPLSSNVTVSLFEEEFGDYSIPHFPELSPNSLLVKSQYAKVIFHDIADTYPTDADICCRYSLTDGVTPRNGDRIALFRVGWSSVQEYIQYQQAPGPPITDKTNLQVLFRASSLPKDVNEFYQLCYVTEDNKVCGASVPFQFRHPYESELCAVEEPGGLVVVRSRTALTDEKLRQSNALNEELKRQNCDLEKDKFLLEEKLIKVTSELQETVDKLTKLELEKQALELRLEDNLHVERHVERLQKDLVVLDSEKNQCLGKLNKAEQHIEVLTVTVDTLSADKEYMAQLLRSETQHKSGVVAEVSQYKGQVESLTHMLEALTQSKELVAQELRVQQATSTELRGDIQRLEIERREQENKLAELEKEKKLLQELLEQTLNAEKAQEEKFGKFQDLEKEKEHLLSELVQSASKKEKEIKMLTDVYEGRLKDLANKVMVAEREAEERRKDVLETTQVNHCLRQQLQDANSVVAEKECSKAALELDLQKALEAKQKAVEHNERLSARLVELENESLPLKQQVQESNHFREVFAALENRIANLEIAHEEVSSNKNIQLDRMESINQRLSELEVEEGKLRCEREDVSTNLEVQEDDLVQSSNKLRVLEERERRNFVAEDESLMLLANPEIVQLRETVNELMQFVDSSKMRITEIDQRVSELEDEKVVLLQQQLQAQERKEECLLREEQVQKELLELQEREREIVREQGGQLAALQTQLDQALNLNSELLANGLSLEDRLAAAKKMEAGGASQEQSSNLSSLEMNVCLEQEQQLKLRLQLAAAEYRKLYTEKQKVEKRLARLYHKLNEKKAKSSSAEASREQPETAELISLSQVVGCSSAADELQPQSQEKGGPNYCFNCDICSVTFPPGAYDLFRQHFDAHLS